MEQSKKKRSLFSRILKVIGICIGVILLLVIGFLGFLTVAEYRPSDLESITVEGTANKNLSTGDTVTLMTWNIGYGALDENSDFFLDGGTMVRAESKEAVLRNMDGIAQTIVAVQPDILLIQEVDRDSARSCGVNEYTYLQEHLSGYDNAFAMNYKAALVPYPLPKTLGKVDAGIASFSAYKMQTAERIQLPVPFSWPMSTINLKRCLLVSRIVIENSDRELVIVNLHLEAYDDGEGKLAQTKVLADLLRTEAEKGNYVIAGGDFNQIFSSADQNAYPLYGENWAAPVIDVTQFGDGFAFLMDETVPSCRLLNMPYQNADHETFQYYLIDGFIVSSNLIVESMETQDLGFAYADHNPLVLRATLS